MADAETFEPDGTLPAGMRALPLSSQPEPGETAYYHRPSESLIVGAALAGADAGQIRLREVALPAAGQEPDASDQRARAARGLRALLGVFARRLRGRGLPAADPTRAIGTSLPARPGGLYVAPG
jgi:hypothetical protein